MYNKIQNYNNLINSLKTECPKVRLADMAMRSQLSVLGLTHSIAAFTTSVGAIHELPLHLG
ncbi:hypothetical protein [Argonema galeatum]|uniref:hypothetical protein n=1 Tax=Argonema galeatum TaxID=2942762 RepID=UPI0020128057|nr:hypothetical protein [Argonema galeatum]MCL1466575.1 hypothetical protein [Argonema galeatum A003/A1]